MEIVGNVVVGKPRVKHETPSHTRGVREGNARMKEPPRAERRSTGINPEARRPIDPRMPNLTPA
jgi:hypothetical protein